MFTELQNQVWTNSATGTVITNNTDTSIDGSSKKLVFTLPNAWAKVTFTSFDLSQWEEISFHVFVRDTLYNDLFSITIGGETFNYTKSELKRNQWNHLLIDCSGMSASTEFTITCLANNLTMFIDYIGYRKVTYNADIDIINALKSHINLDYGVSLTLAEDALVGDTSISLTSTNVQGYITDTSILEIDDGSGTIETVELIDKSGNLSEALTNNFSSGDEVRIICPVRSEDYESLEPDPICGIKVFDMTAMKQLTVQKTKNNSKIKEYLGALGVMVYIDCSSKKKLLQMAREYAKKYGDEFTFLLDGEQVEIFMESDNFIDDVIGNNPRKAFYYRIEPQPYLYAKSQSLGTINLTTTVSAVEDVI